LFDLKSCVVIGMSSTLCAQFVKIRKGLERSWCSNDSFLGFVRGTLDTCLCAGGMEAMLPAGNG